LVKEEKFCNYLKYMRVEKAVDPGSAGAGGSAEMTRRRAGPEAVCMLGIRAFNHKVLDIKTPLFYCKLFIYDKWQCQQQFRRRTGTLL
jgi:hypothetical protein